LEPVSSPQAASRAAAAPVPPQIMINRLNSTRREMYPARNSSTISRAM
jgi:hypothetical protein